MLKQTKRALIFFLAVIFVVIGIAGFILPLIPGLVFIALALLIFSIFFPGIRTWADRHTIKYPKLHQVIIKLDLHVRRILGDL